MASSNVIRALAVAGVLCVAGAPALAADTLVVKNADGTFGPGVATSWQAAETSVSFELASDQDAEAVAGFLRERLANARVEVSDGRLVITGIPQATLLDQLSTLSLTGGGDPLADLAGLGGGVVAMDKPEGGGSIRASKPAGIAAAPRTIAPHDPQERLHAEVVEVERGTFPHVELELRVSRPAKAGPLRGKLRRGKVIEAPVLFTTTSSGIDLTLAENQRNLVAWYLEKGDRVTIHALAGEGDALEIDFIARR